MRFTVASILALATTVLAQFEATPGFNVFKTPATDEKVPAGKPYLVEWTYNSKMPGSIKVELYGGTAANTLQLIEVLATGVDATSEKYTWSVAPTLGTQARYGIRLVLESAPTTFQWSNSFTIGANNGTVSSSTSASASASATSSAPVSTSTSSAPVTSTKTATSTSKSVDTSITKTITSVSSTSTHYSNSTTSASEEETSTSTFASVTRSATSSSSSTGAPVPTGGANAAAAGSFAALLGGVAVAVLAL
ncbi:Ser-Thr-rich glycosyl-phosphatidyl-inositol-anchored membrane family-domain-containing protein [Cladorrhinum sp. PSN259]|nr:Ser-Thr-rich glycosyl-phosphatidyl-inositol-anchored membrane family-domain-containing protein [Cladorrhinum sp. PSN259]